jgi:hypothetical protein
MHIILSQKTQLSCIFNRSVSKFMLLCSAPKSDKFEDGSKFWARIEAEQRNAKIDVKRSHNTETF